MEKLVDLVLCFVPLLELSRYQTESRTTTNQ